MEFSIESLETPALTKAHLAELLFEQIGLNKRESKDMIDAFFDLISDSLVEGTDVKISGFGNILANPFSSASAVDDLTNCLKTFTVSILSLLGGNKGKSL